MFRLFSLHFNKWILILLTGDIAAYCLTIVLGSLAADRPVYAEQVPAPGAF